MKRIPTYVPEEIRDLLMGMSKADLAELAWDYAVRTVGEEMPVTSAWQELCRTRDILRAWAGRRKPKARTVAP